MNSSELLTNEEMSALMPDAASDGVEKRRRVTAYNFRRPDRLSKEQIRSLYLLHDHFAHAVSSSLPLFLRAISEVTLISVEQQSYADFQRGVADPSVLFGVTLAPLPGAAAIEMSPAVAFPIVDRMLGGAGNAVGEKRQATEIELQVLEGFLPRISDALREAWKPLIELNVETTACETRPQLLQTAAPNEICAVVGFQMRVGEAQGTMSICLPVSLLEPIVEKLDNSAPAVQQQTAPAATAAVLRTLSHVRLRAAAELCKTPAAAKDLLALNVGDVLRTNHRVEQPVNVKINNVTKFCGNLAACDNRVVVQISENVRRKETASVAAL